MKVKSRIGHKMLEVYSYVRDNPGCTKLAAAKFICPNGVIKNNKNPYDIVNRAIKAGLIKAEKTSLGSYSLTVVQTLCPS